MKKIITNLFALATTALFLSSCGEQENTLPQTKEEAIAMLDEKGVPRGYYGTAFREAIELNNMKMIRIFTIAGEAPDTPLSSYTNQTPLHVAAYYGNVECLKYFLSMPNVNPFVRTNGKQYTPREMLEDSIQRHSQAELEGIMYHTFYCKNESDFVNQAGSVNNPYVLQLKQNRQECVKLLKEAEEQYHKNNS